MRWTASESPLWVPWALFTTCTPLHCLFAIGGCLRLARGFSCGNVCGEGRTCKNGVCSCPAGETLCGDTCVITDDDSDNCGGCPGMSYLLCCLPFDYRRRGGTMLGPSRGGAVGLSHGGRLGRQR